MAGSTVGLSDARRNLGSQGNSGFSKQQDPPDTGWGPKCLRSTGCRATRSDKSPRIACTHIGGTTWWLHPGSQVPFKALNMCNMSRVQLKLALYSCSGICTLCFNVALRFPLRFAIATGQVFSIKFTWKQCLFWLKQILEASPFSENFCLCLSFEQLVSNNPSLVSQGRGKLPPGPRLRAVWFPISSFMIPMSNFCLEFRSFADWLIFLEVPTYQAAEAETMLGDPSGEHRVVSFLSLYQMMTFGNDVSSKATQVSHGFPVSPLQDS